MSTQIYQCSGSEGRYGSFPKFLSRGKWNPDAVAVHLLKWIQSVFPDWVYVYDPSHAEKTGTSQYGLHFFPNFSFNGCHRNPLKFHYGHEFGALGVLCATAPQRVFFPVWVKLIGFPQTLRDKRDAVLRCLCSKIPWDLILFDR